MAWCSLWAALQPVTGWGGHTVPICLCILVRQTEWAHKKKYKWHKERAIHSDQEINHRKLHYKTYTIQTNKWGRVGTSRALDFRLTSGDVDRGVSAKGSQAVGCPMRHAAAWNASLSVLAHVFTSCHRPSSQGLPLDHYSASQAFCSHTALCSKSLGLVVLHRTRGWKTQ